VPWGEEPPPSPLGGGPPHQKNHDSPPPPPPSIPDDVIGIFHLHNPSCRTLALASTHPLTEKKYHEYFMVGKGGRCVWLTTLPPPGTLRACTGIVKKKPKLYRAEWIVE